MAVAFLPSAFLSGWANAGRRPFFPGTLIISLISAMMSAACLTAALLAEIKDPVTLIIRSLVAGLIFALPGLLIHTALTRPARAIEAGEQGG